MAILGWIISFISLFAGLALYQQPVIAHADSVMKGLFLASFLSFPPIWRESPMGITRGQRISACLAMILSLPLVFMQP